ncbi:MAG: beta-lactamase family protein [Weeksellaceae bacterium]|nr:beta-lactamase family protein [Bacteroidota bacterium]MCG2781503.1 beta-lactamase family protein [Weeksellaceae bacterium]
MKTKFLLIFLCLVGNMAFAQNADIQKKLKGFDKEMAKALKDWNMPGVGVGIVKDGKLVFVKGYGYRDYEKKLPITANTLFPIASNTKLFTATAVGLLVHEGKLDWDKPIKTYVPAIKFYDNELNNTITIRDMLAHRTGVTRHDLIWFKSTFNRSELFEKLKYLEPAQPLRQGFLYNNLMYAASGHIIEIMEGKTWENYLKERIFSPLKMNSTVFSIDDMKKQQDFFVPFNEKRDTDVLYQIPYLEETEGLGPAGSVISNITDLSHWLSALMNKGIFEGKQVIPEAVVKATMEPSTVLKNGLLDQGFTEVLNPVYGMGRQSVSYRGHQLVLHGGDLPGIHSQISYMPQDNVGVIVFVIGDHSFSYNSITYNIYEHLLGLSVTPWSERGIKNRDAGKKLGKGPCKSHGRTGKKHKTVTPINRLYG